MPRTRGRVERGMSSSETEEDCWHIILAVFRARPDALCTQDDCVGIGGPSLPDSDSDKLSSVEEFLHFILAVFRARPDALCTQDDCVGIGGPSLPDSDSDKLS